MKTAISIPDDIFISADRTAKKLGIPRSQLFTRAIEDFIQNHSKEKTTEQLNRIYPKKSLSSDNTISETSLQLLRKSLKNDSW
jgi:metal-responsive CopG/Arc/MetJ family transcriptional regulator